MATKTKFKTDAFEAIHSSASALYKVDAINKTTMRSFDGVCLTAPTEINSVAAGNLNIEKVSWFAADFLFIFSAFNFRSAKK